MSRFRTSSPWRVAVLTLVSVLMAVSPARAQSPLKIQQWSGAIDFGAQEVSPFELEGVASHLGKFTAYGEVRFDPDLSDEILLVGHGVIVFRAADGDQLVGVVSWTHDLLTQTGSLHHISWRDAVQFDDTTVVASTGRFAHERPKGIVALEYLLLATIVGLGLIIGFSN